MVYRAAIRAGKLYRTLGVRTLVITGCVLVAIGCWRLAGLDPTTATDTLWPSVVLLGFSIAIIQVPTQTLALQGLSGEPLNKATSLLSAGKFIVGAVGPAMLVTYFDQQEVWYAHQPATQASAAALAHRVPGVPADLPVAQQIATYLGAQAGTSALRDVFSCGSARRPAAHGGSAYRHHRPTGGARAGFHHSLSGRGGHGRDDHRVLRCGQRGDDRFSGSVHHDGVREVVGVDVGLSEDAVVWHGFLQRLLARGLHGVQLAIRDADCGLPCASYDVFLGASWQRCRVHFLRNVFAKVPKTAQPMVSATIISIVEQPR